MANQYRGDSAPQRVQAVQTTTPQPQYRGPRDKSVGNSDRIKKVVWAVIAFGILLSFFLRDTQRDTQKDMSVSFPRTSGNTIAGTVVSSKSSEFYTIERGSAVLIELGQDLSYSLHEGDSFYVQFLNDGMEPLKFRLAGEEVGPEPVLIRGAEMGKRFTFTGRYLKLIGPDEGRAVVQVTTK